MKAAVAHVVDIPSDIRSYVDELFRTFLVEVDDEVKIYGKKFMYGAIEKWLQNHRSRGPGLTECRTRTRAQSSSYLALLTSSYLTLLTPLV